MGLKRLDSEQLPQAAVLAAAFFVASLVSVPLGPSTVHLVLNGLMGLMLGWGAVPALVVALLLQAAFFGYGGVVVLGVNAMNLALPALAAGWLLRPVLARLAPGRWFWIGAGAGVLGVLGTAGLVALSLGLSGEPFLPAARIVVLTYLPLAAVEALVAGTIVAFLARVEPTLLIPEAVPRDR